MKSATCPHCAVRNAALERLTRERDELKEERENLYLVANEKLEKLTKEREEARAEVERYKAIRDRGYPNKSWDTLILQLADAEKERDGLKAALEEIARRLPHWSDPTTPASDVATGDIAREALAKFGGGEL